MLLTAMLFLFSTANVSAQNQSVKSQVAKPDVITLLNGDDINASVQKVGDTDIEYKKWSNKNGPAYTLKKSEIFRICYANGEKDVFFKKEEQAVVAPNQQQTNPLQSTNASQQTATDAQSNEYVEINGVKWATRNVDEPGTFAATPESPGMFYQWNIKEAIHPSGKGGYVATGGSSAKIWDEGKDPSPNGFRVPTADELKSLLDTEKVTGEWLIQNHQYGYKFTDKTSGNIIFLPAAGALQKGKNTIANTFGDYWSSKKKNLLMVNFLQFYKKKAVVKGFGYVGIAMPIRPVVAE
ncbi:hypothetical protein JCM30204_49040 [Dysgonomonas termitidis]